MRILSAILLIPFLSLMTSKVYGQSIDLCLLRVSSTRASTGLCSPMNEMITALGVPDTIVPAANGMEGGYDIIYGYSNNSIVYHTYDSLDFTFTELVIRNDQIKIEIDEDDYVFKVGLIEDPDEFFDRVYYFSEQTVCIDISEGRVMDILLSGNNHTDKIVISQKDY